MRMPISCRTFLGTISAAAAAVGLTERRSAAEAEEPLALLGGKPVRRHRFTRWPIIAENDEKSWMEVLRKGRWCRVEATTPNRFEETWSRHDGGQALHRRRQRHECPDHVAGRAGDRARRRGPRAPLYLRRHGQRGPGPPRAADLRRYRPGDLPDRCPPARIRDQRTHGRILPVHIGGSAADMDTILSVAPGTSCRSSKTPARRRWPNGTGRKLSTLGDLGCFSFQASKNLNSGEGARSSPTTTGWPCECRSFQNNGRGQPSADRLTSATVPISA